MPKVQIVGRVLPEPVKISVESPEVKWKWEEKNLELGLRIVIKDSLITAECEIERYEPEFITELHKRVSDLTRASVNMIAFASGYGLSISLDTFINPRGERSQIVPIDPAIPTLCTAFGLGSSRRPDFDTVYRLVLTEPPLFRALNDLIEAITVPHVSSVNCGRVIDSIRRMITSDSTAAISRAWEAMHSALNVTREYQEWSRRDHLRNHPPNLDYYEPVHGI
jgi:hypothetical protein